MHIEEITNKLRDFNSDVVASRGCCETVDFSLDVAYLLVQNKKLQSIVEQADEAIAEFTDKHFHGGSKSNRTDYVAFGIPTADIFKLRETLQAIRRA